MPDNKTFYLIENPTACMFYAREIIQKENVSVVVLPDHVDIPRFERFLLDNQDFFYGVDIYNISSFPKKYLGSKGYFELPERFDQVKLSEYFSAILPKSLYSPALKAVQELKGGDFDQDYINDRLSKRKNKDGKVLTEVFQAYENFLRSNKLFDDADYRRFFINEILNPSSKLIHGDEHFVFVGFNTLGSFEMGLISAVSMKAAKTSIVSPDIINLDTDYSKILSSELISKGFKTITIKSERKKTEIYELRNISEEIFYAISNLGRRGGAVYATDNLGAYYALARYHSGENTVSIASAIRIDKSTVFNVICTLINLNFRDWLYEDVIKIINFLPLWGENQTLQSEVDNFTDRIYSRLILPRGKTLWVDLANSKDFPNIKKIFNLVSENLKTNGKPEELKNGINKVIEIIEHNTSKNKYELSSVKNLISRVTEAIVEDNITSDDLVIKLLNHAEENYIEKGPRVFKSISLELASLCPSNMSDNIFFVGLNEEAFIERFKEDLVMNDNFILAFRGDGLLYPTSREKCLIHNKVISDALKNSKCSFASNRGKLSSLVKEIEPELAPSLARVNMCSLKTDEMELDIDDFNFEHKFETISPTLIESYIKCPYITFAERLVSARKRDSYEFSLNPMNVGRFLHSSLEILLPKTINNIEIDVESELNVIVSSKEYRELVAHPLKDAFIKYYAGIIRRILKNELDFMKEKGLEIFQNTELKFKVDLDFVKDVKISGTIDRIDLDKKKNELYVADYKTSQLPKRGHVDNGIDIQMLVYIMAVMKNYPNYNRYGGYYISIKDLRRLELNFDSSDKPRILFSNYGDRAVSGLIEGNYKPQPIDIENCEKCLYRRCCGTL